MKIISGVLAISILLQSTLVYTGPKPNKQPSKPFYFLCAFVLVGCAYYLYSNYTEETDPEKNQQSPFMFPILKKSFGEKLLGIGKNLNSQPDTKLPTIDTKIPNSQIPIISTNRQGQFKRELGEALARKFGPRSEVLDKPKNLTIPTVSPSSSMANPFNTVFERLGSVCLDVGGTALQYKSLTFLERFSQESSSLCGMFCLHNALEIEKVLELKKPTVSIDSLDVKKIDNFHLGLDQGEIVKLAKDLGIAIIPLVLNSNNNIERWLANYGVDGKSHAYFKEFVWDVNRTDDSLKLTIGAPEGYSTKELTDMADIKKEEILAKELQDIKNNAIEVAKHKTQVIHFACGLNKDSHWILVSVVLAPGKRPALAIFDNLNRPVSSYTGGYDFIQKIGELFN